ncbi:MAG: ABC transporter ATP-binding protein [Bacteroidota bacterium]
MQNILEVQNLGKQYRGSTSYALSNLTYRLPKGKICAVVGASGSGKTTFLRLIAGLERPSSGTILLNEEVVSNMQHIVPPQRRGVGMVFQNFALFPHLTVQQNIAYGMNNSVNKAQTVTELLALVQLPNYETRYPHELSGGEQQRIALVRTLARHPKLLLLDEPFSNLDTALKVDLRKALRNIVHRLQLSMIFITHDIQDALDLADELIFLEAGQLVECGSLEQLLKAPKTPLVQDVFQNLKASAIHLTKLLSE